MDHLESETCVKLVAKKPPTDVYVYVYLSHSIMAKTPQYVTDWITLFHAQTFWPIGEALNSAYAGLSRPRSSSET